MAEINLSEIMELKDKSRAELQAKYKELFGQEPPSSNKVFLWRKIVHHIQESKHAALSETSSSRINALISQYDPVNNKALKRVDTRKTGRDLRLPIPGTVITKEYKGQRIEVKVLDKNFEYKGKPYRSLTAIAGEVTGDHWNGYLFFNL